MALKTFTTADGSANQALVTNGSGVLSFAAVGGGKVLQVVQTVLTTATTMSVTTSPTDISGLSVVITPSLTSSKILILVHIAYSNSSGDGIQGFLQRNGTNIGIGTTTGLGTQATIPFLQANSNNYWGFVSSTTFLDAPSSVSALTYKVQAGSVGGTLSFSINRSGRGSADGAYISTITAMEIGI